MEKFITVRCADSQKDTQVLLGQTHNVEEHLKGVLLPVGSDFLNEKLNEIVSDLEVQFNRLMAVAQEVVKGKNSEEVFLKWLEDIAESNGTAPIPSQLNNKQKVFTRIASVMKTLYNVPGSLISDLVNTAEGYVFTVTMGSKVIFQDLVEPIYHVIEEEVDQIPPQLETPDQPEPLGQEEVEVEIDQVDLVEETPLLSVIECEVIASPEEEEEEAVGTIAVTAPVIPHWQKYSVNNGLNKW